MLCGFGWVRKCIWVKFTHTKNGLPARDCCSMKAAARPAISSSMVSMRLRVSGPVLFSLLPSALTILLLNTGKVVGVNPTGGISNYFIGNRPDHWQLNIPHYAQVKATGVYHGIDLVFRGNQGVPEYDFVVTPGADPQQIRMQFEGAASLRMDRESGDLVLTTSNGTEFRHAQPRIYQEAAGRKASVKGGFEVRPDGPLGSRWELTTESCL
jgi:hypothetical protein